MSQPFSFSVDQIDLIKVHQTLNDAFNMAELHELCFRLQVDFDNLPPGGKRVKAQGLVSQCQRLRQLQALVEAILEMRPNIEPHTLILSSSEGAPFKGLAYFDEPDAHLFFGRDRLIARLAAHLQQHNFLAVVGTSGSGKSSVVRAGLVPTLKQGMQANLPAGSKDWLYHTMTPTATPLKELATILTASESVMETAKLLDALQQDARSLDLYVNRLLSGSEKRLLLIIDQFEELFTLCKDANERQQFVDNLVGMVKENGRSLLILTLRADFYRQCLQYQNLHALLETQQIIVPSMEPAELRKTIEAPAQQASLQFEDGLVELFLRDVGQEPGAMPLLSHTLLETWRRRDGNTLTLAGYTAAGGVHGAIGKTADSLYNDPRRTETQRSLIRSIFLRLTELGEGTQDTRRRVQLSELLSIDADSEAIQTVIKLLADARLLTTDEETAEVAHEALIREWPALREWLDDNREGLRLHRQLMEAAHLWKSLQRDSGALYRGVRLGQAQEWAAQNRGQLNVLEGAFLEASETAVADEAKAREATQKRELQQARFLAEAQTRELEEQKRRTQITRWGLMVIVALLFLTIGAASYGYNQANLADTRARFIQSRALASDALNMGEHEGEKALLLAIEASKQAPTILAYTAIHEQLPFRPKMHNILAHEGPVLEAKWNGNENLILTSSVDGTAKLWAADSGQLLQILAHKFGIREAKWNGDDSLILTSSDDGTAKMWTADSGQLLQTFAHDAAVWEAKWNGGESLILTSSIDGTAKVWAADSGQLLHTLTHEDGAVRAKWNGNESLILTSSHDGTAKVWAADSGQLLHTLAHFGPVSEAKWNKDESLLLTHGSDNTAKVWAADSGQLLQTFAHEAPVWEAKWNGDESLILTSGGDRTAKVWVAESGQLLQTLSHEDGVSGAKWNEDESLILTSSHDGTAKVWVADSVQLLHTLTPVVAAKWNGDESLILTSGGDRTAKVWVAKSGQLLQTLSHEDGVSGAKWNEDESLILTSSHDGTAKVWTADTGQLLQILAHEAPVWEAKWNGDESLILTSSRDDGTAKVWMADTGQLLHTLTHEAPVLEAKWNGDESLILTSSRDGTVKVWGADTGQLVQTLTHEAPVRKAEWNRDGSQILTNSHDGTAKVWDADTGQLVQVLTHEAPVWEAKWNGDESLILTSSWDNTARVWDADTGQLLQTLAHEDFVVEAKWNRGESLILTSSRDSMVKVWDAETGQLIFLIEAESRIVFAGWNEDESRIHVVTRDGVFRTYFTDMDFLTTYACEHASRNLNWAEWQLHFPREPYRKICEKWPVHPSVPEGEWP